MRPLKLEMQAFGPYVTKQCVDFDMFDDCSLFLIRGETGSGKTMILDAITYALYGKSSGGQREDLESMRSRFASDSEDTFIDFTFSLHEHIYRFYRKVEVKTKRNKEKVRKVSVDAGEIIDSVYYPFFENPKLKNIEEKANELIGLTHEQFIQVMILPQGKFEQLLTSKSEEKQAILKTLFQMDRWGKINEYLVEKVKDERDVIESKKQQMQAYLKGMNIAQYQDIEIWLEGALKQEQEYQDILQKEKQNLQEKRCILEQQKSIHTLKKEQEEALKQQQVLDAQAEEMKKLKVFIAQQKQLMEVGPYVETVKNTNTYLQQRQVNLTKANQMYERMEKEMLSFKQKEEQLRELEQKLSLCTTRLDTLHNRKQVYESFDALKTKEQLHSRKEQNEEIRLKKEQQALIQAIALRDDINNNIKELRLQVKQKAIKEDEFKLLEQAYFLYQKQSSVEKEQVLAKQKQAKLTNEVNKQKEQLDKIVKQHEVMYRHFLDDSALQLAQLLKEQEPCPVCGSLHHPHPYTVEAGYLDVVTLKRLQEQVDKEKTLLDSLMRKLQGEDVRIETLSKQLQGLQEEIRSILHKPFELQEYERVKQEVLLLREKDKELDELQKRLDKGIGIVQDKEVLVRQLETSYQAMKLDGKVIETQLRNSKAQFLDGILTLDELVKQTKEMTTQVTSIKKEIENLRIFLQELLVSYEKSKNEVVTCKQEVEQAMQQEQAAKEILTTQCLVRNIKVEELVNLQPAKRIQELDNQTHAYEVSCVQVATTLHNIEEKLRNVTMMDMVVLQEEVKQLEEHEATLSKELVQLQSTKRLYEQVQKNIKNIQKELEIQEPAFIKLQQFVKAMRGDNGVGIERYVLGVMLSSITQSANQLLEHVHQGRYQIYRSDEASGRTRKYGLELSIYDSYTCSYRSVVSLSGGEKFLVSLALSLALSAVVQARNGGIHLDAMFIDEGFGTLDEHSIADALQVLQSMSSQKGMVGIISHVELLKENIAAGIEVEKTRQGSRLTLRKG